MKTSYVVGLLFFLFITCREQQNAAQEESDISDRYANTDRFLWQKPELVMRLFGDLSNKTVADIGAGYGIFTFPLAKRAEKVIAIDISQEVESYLIKNKPEGYEDRIEVRLVSPSSPQLKNGEADAVLLVNTYMYLDNRVDYLKKVYQGSSSGAKILINDFKKKRTSVGPKVETRIPLYQVEAELTEAGFEVILTDDTSLEYQYIVLARKP